jgi:bifunctional ADP-heptose synthase (sugar kinase/adenylyltransferase)
MQLNSVKDFKVLVAGDAIIDRYRFCNTLGRGTKESIISVSFEREETYKGGVWACGSHLSELVSQVDIWHGDTVTINTKYLGAYSQKLFSVHDSRIEPNDFKPQAISSYDLVIVFDYGHGFFTPHLREKITREARWLAVNAQSNSSNYGFNRINEKWPIANLAVCDELEARLAAHEADLPIEDVILKLPYSSIIVTLGSHGAIGYANREFYRESALTERPVDLLGAGDAVLSVVAPFAKAGFSIKELVHLGNVAGAIKVGILGHRGHVTKTELEKHL